ncbi:hypothetical protein Sjap_001149 [Stephania japonica]|uniref:Uncharacterized protein n=1 Tax=Stephania japonica TaxID=461633 RepID=A0AAP0PT81_9MAGN
MGGRRRRRWLEKELTGAKRTRADGEWTTTLAGERETMLGSSKARCDGGAETMVEREATVTSKVKSPSDHKKHDEHGEHPVESFQG